jgi:tetratricopeptide (TPR) repeat protein
VYSLATDGRVHWKYETNTTLEKMALGDINGDGMQEIVVVTNEPKMYGLALNYTFVQKTSADNIYSEGTRLYRDNSLLEARETLSRAMAIYYNLGFQTEVDKVQSLIDKIDAQISEDRRELADTYYEKARDYYITGEYDSAKRFVSMSKEIYKEFGDSENVLKCELLELRINTVSMPTTMPIVTTVPTTMPNQAVVTIPLGYVLLIGLLLVTSIAVLLYVKKSKDEKREENVKESWENSLLSGNNKVDIKLGGEEDEE